MSLKPNFQLVSRQSFDFEFCVDFASMNEACESRGSLPFLNNLYYSGYDNPTKRIKGGKGCARTPLDKNLEITMLLKCREEKDIRLPILRIT